MAASLQGPSRAVHGTEKRPKMAKSGFVSERLPRKNIRAGSFPAKVSLRHLGKSVILVRVFCACHASLVASELMSGECELDAYCVPWETNNNHFERCVLVGRCWRAMGA